MFSFFGLSSGDGVIHEVRLGVSPKNSQIRANLLYGWPLMLGSNSFMVANFPVFICIVQSTF